MPQCVSCARRSAGEKGGTRAPQHPSPPRSDTHRGPNNPRPTRATQRTRQTGPTRSAATHAPGPRRTAPPTHAEEETQPNQERKEAATEHPRAEAQRTKEATPPRPTGGTPNAAPGAKPSSNPRSSAGGGRGGRRDGAAPGGDWPRGAHRRAHPNSDLPPGPEHGCGRPPGAGAVQTRRSLATALGYYLQAAWRPGAMTVKTAGRTGSEGGSGEGQAPPRAARRRSPGTGHMHLRLRSGAVQMGTPAGPQATTRRLTRRDHWRPARCTGAGRDSAPSAAKLLCVAMRRIAGVLSSG